MSILDVQPGSTKYVRPFFGVLDWVAAIGKERGGRRYSVYIFGQSDEMKGFVKGTETLSINTAAKKAEELESRRGDM
jgi:hypothetical protein